MNTLPFKKAKLATFFTILFATSAYAAVEKEPNNESQKANPFLTQEKTDALTKLYSTRTGQLSKGNDTDFYSLDGCFDTKTKTIKTTCNADNNGEVALSFSCDKNADKVTGDGGGWYLGVHDVEGVLQSSYRIVSSDCKITPESPNGFEFSFPTEFSQKYALSVVADCHDPVYSVDPTTKNIKINDVTATKLLGNATDKKSTKTSIDNANKLLVTAQNRLVLSESGLVYYYVNDYDYYLTVITNALDFAEEIYNDITIGTTPKTTITAIINVANTAKFAAMALPNWLEAIDAVYKAQKAVNSAQKAVGDAKTEYDTQCEKSSTCDEEKDAILKKLAQKITSKETILSQKNTELTQIKSERDEAKSIVTNAITSISKAVDDLYQLEDAFNSNPDINSPSSTFGKKNQACTKSNPATYQLAQIHNRLKLSVANAVVVEGGAINFLMTLDKVPNNDIYIPYTLSGTATHNTDYKGQPEVGVLTIKKGKLETYFSLNSLIDKIDEKDGETLILTFDKAAGVSLINTSATITIKDKEVVTTTTTPTTGTGTSTSTTGTGTTDTTDNTPKPIFH